ncbi:MAG: hypothetical protein VXX44_06320, partial [Bacteroidota bacterium]|nr:hypothetical protein [Bacteroidota bacterium]
MSSTPQKKPMKISGNFTDNDWKDLRKNPEIVRALTDIDFDALPEMWNDVITVFENRIKTRFLNPIDKIKEGDVRSGEGFSITLIAVVLMEALAAFQFGKIYNADMKKTKRAPHEYDTTAQLYKALFKHSASLKDGI